MIKPLRKRHLQIWSLLAFLIPAGIISGYLAVPKQVFNNLLQEEKSEVLPVVISKIEGKNYSVYLRSSTDKKNYQLQWINKKELTIPALLLYKTSLNPTKGEFLKSTELIGRIESKGSFYIPLKVDSTNIYHFILYDIIHHQTTDSLKFNQ